MHTFLAEFAVIALVGSHYLLEPMPRSVAWACYALFALGVLAKLSHWAMMHQPPQQPPMMPETGPSRGSHGHEVDAGPEEFSTPDSMIKK